MAIEHKIGCIVVDNFHELELVENMSRSEGAHESAAECNTRD